jgi:hypothetical protein
MRIMVVAFLSLYLFVHQGLAAQGPDAVARAVFSAFERGDWATVAASIDSAAAKTFRESELALLASWLASREALQAAKKTGTTFYGYSSDGILKSEDIAKHGSTRIEAFLGKPTFGDLVRLEPQLFLRRWLESVHSEPRDSTIAIRRRIVGVVLEGDSLAHVLYRPEGPGIEYEHVWTTEILVLQRRNAAWKVLLPNQDLAWSIRLMHLLDPSEK